MGEGGSPGERPAYRIKVEGQLPAHWSDWFNGPAITREAASGGIPTTTLTGPVPDQAALHGILNRIRDLNVKLIPVNQVESQKPCSYHSGHRSAQIRPTKSLSICAICALEANEMGKLLKMAWRNVWRNWRRTLNAVITIILGLTLMLLLDGVIVGSIQAACGNSSSCRAGTFRCTPRAIASEPSGCHHIPWLMRAKVGGDVAYTVVVELDEQPAGLRWGMSVDVQVETK